MGRGRLTPSSPRFFQLVSGNTLDISPLVGIVFFTRKVSGYRIKGFRHDGQNQTRRQSLLPQAANARSSLAFDPQGGSNLEQPQGGKRRHAFARKVSGYRIKPFRHDGRNQTRRQSLLPQSANARSSLAFDLAIAVIGFSSGWVRIPRANGSFLIDERRGENETVDSARAV